MDPAITPSPESVPAWFTVALGRLELAVPAERERTVTGAIAIHGAVGRHRHEESGADEGECEVPIRTGALPAVELQPAVESGVETDEKSDR